MQLFSKNPAKALEAARADHQKLKSRLDEAKQVVIAKRDAAEGLALAPESEMAKAEAEYRAAQDRVNITLAPALAKAEALVRNLEAEEKAAALTAQRAATAAEVEQDAAALAKAARQYLDGAAALAKITLKVATYVPEYANLNMVCNEAGVKTPPLLEVGDKFMRSYAQGVLGGAFPATLPAVAHAPILQAPIIPQTKTVFATRNISWTNADGHLRMAKQWVEVTLPPEIADRALLKKCAVPLGDPIWKKQRGYQSMNDLTPEDCTNLDANPPPVQSDPRVAEPVKFEVVDRGPPRQFKVART
jgi:hypothetical protein